MMTGSSERRLGVHLDVGAADARPPRPCSRAASSGTSGSRVLAQLGGSRRRPHRRQHLLAHAAPHCGVGRRPRSCAHGIMVSHNTMVRSTPHRRCRAGLPLARRGKRRLGAERVHTEAAWPTRPPRPANHDTDAGQQPGPQGRHGHARRLHVRVRGRAGPRAGFPPHGPRPRVRRQRDGVHDLPLREAHGKRFTALPVFLVRGFHHGAILCNTRAGIRNPKDLEGQQVGVNRGYTVTTGVWARAILQDEYGVDLSKVTWVLSGDEHVAAYRPPATSYPWR